MVKQDISLKGIELERHAQDALYDLLCRVPGIDIDKTPKHPQLLPDALVPDIRLRISYRGDTFDLIGEVRSSGQPRIAYSAIFHLQQLLVSYNTPTLPVFVAPFISKDVRDVCEREGVSYFDLAGNARIAFNGVYIEREAADNPFKEARETRSLFTPKAARILRVMFRDIGPNSRPPWRVIDLANEAGVSLGQVSNIGKALVEAGYASKDDRGISLVEPDRLLDTWVKVYKLPKGENRSYYTTLHGAPLTERLKHVLGLNKEDGRIILSGFSAAQWHAPYARSGATSLYLDQRGLDRAKSELKLGTATRGENVTVKILEDDGPLDDAIQPADQMWCTSPLQTYLDLSWAGDRGQEAAAILRQKWFPWP